MSSFSKFSIIRNVRQKPRGFNYRSRFYDAKEEEREKRRQRIEDDIRREKESATEGIVTPARSIKFDRKKNRSAQQRKSLIWSNIRLLIIIALLVVGAIYIWFTFKAKYL